MSARALNWAFSVPIMGASKAVLIRLADIAGPTGSCQFENESGDLCAYSRERLAAEAGVSLATWKRACKFLRDSGYLESKFRKRGATFHRLKIPEKFGENACG